MTGLPREKILEMFRAMCLIRSFEEHARDLFMNNMMRGGTHMYIGEEAVAVGVCNALTREDYITSTHRGHGHCLAKGGDPRAMMAELLGRATGTCKGKGGSMHIADLDLGILGANGIVGGGIGLAAGAALAAKYRADGRVAVCFFGDGAINQGVFYETANMAALWKLPLIYVCERNRFAEFSYSERYFPLPDIAQRTTPFGFTGIEVDGNDVLAVYEAAEAAALRARRGEGPSLLVANTYRIMGHTIGDPLTYRKKGEAEEWSGPDHDPILRFESWICGKDAADQAVCNTIRGEALRQVEEAVEFAKNSPEPEVDALFDDVYAA